VTWVIGVEVAAEHATTAVSERAAILFMLNGTHTRSEMPTSRRLLAAGDTTAAVAEYRRGIEVGTRNHDPVIGETILKLDALEASRAKAKAP
jgi:hypothetical protein